MINQISFADPVIPQGGTIRETIGGTYDVPDHGVATHTFYLFSIYGTGTDVDTIMANMVVGTYTTITTVSQSRSDNIDSYIPVDAPLGTYSCATIMADAYDEATGTISGIWDTKVDANVLTIVAGLGASIVSTSFSSI